MVIEHKGYSITVSDNCPQSLIDDSKKSIDSYITFCEIYKRRGMQNMVDVENFITDALFMWKCINDGVVKF